ncbi:MAG: sulfite exporter TauE/SafE family protein [Xanthomonadales bacterium]|nr:sulfite exporter TauE/SafE family protein [Xanthomonadales bacterium]
MLELNLLDWLIFATTGAVAGLAAGYLGIGGGMVIVPVLSLYLQDKFPLFTDHSQQAVATSLATILVTGTVAALSHHRRGAIDWDWVKQLAPGLLIGALAGAWIAGQISSDWLIRIFSIFALLSGLRMLMNTPLAATTFSLSPLAKRSSGVVIGSMSSLLGIGGGTLSVPMLNACGVKIHQAVAIASAAGVVIAIAGTSGFIITGLDLQMSPPGSFGYIYLPALLGIVTTSILTAPLGAKLVHKSRPQLVKQVFGCLLILVAARLMLRSF